MGWRGAVEPHLWAGKRSALANIVVVIPPRGACFQYTRKLVQLQALAAKKAAPLFVYTPVL